MPVAKSKRRVWTHPKYKDVFSGHTEKYIQKPGESMFVLKPSRKNGNTKVFESWQAAIKAGWSRK